MPNKSLIRTETDLTVHTELGNAILLAEDDDGNTQPITVASSINEARELAESDLRQRRRKLDLGQEAGFCPARYILWARGIDGEYVVATTFEN